MLRESERAVLALKILSNYDSFGQDTGNGCLKKALDLYEQHGGGTVYWIGQLSKLSLNFGLFHAYFVPPTAEAESLALNQADNDFGQYPPLTVAEVEFLGEPQNPNLIRQMKR